MINNGPVRPASIGIGFATTSDCVFFDQSRRSEVDQGDKFERHLLESSNDIARVDSKMMTGNVHHSSRALSIFIQNVQIALLWLLPVTVSDARFDHSLWDNLLREHVVMMQQDQVSRIDFPALTFKLGQLNAYLTEVSRVKRSDFSDWDRPEQLAFLINAYNAFTVERRLRVSASPALAKAYPHRNLRQKRVLMSWIQNQWNIQLIHLMGELMSLRELDEDWIRRPGLYDEPRVHFALYRGFHEGPPLLNRAYNGFELEQQLERATRAFLSNRSRNRLDTMTHTLEVSELFNWYQGDFERGWQSWPGLSQFFIHYRDYLADDPEAKQMLADDNFQILFQEFNWSQQ